MKLPELIEESLNERDLREVLDNMNLDHSCPQDELFENVLNAIEGKSANEALSLFSNDLLTRICKAKGIKQDWPFFRDSNEQMIRKICSSVLDKDEAGPESDQPIERIDLPRIIDEAPHESDEQSPTELDAGTGSPPNCTDPNFEKVTRDIEEWSPRIEHDHEGGYRDELNAWLWSRGHRTTIRKGDPTVSVLVDDKYPIMIVIEPELSDFHRAFGQIHRHLEGFQSVTMVICRPKPDGELEFFEERVRRSLTYSRYPYRIIRKN